MGLTCVWGACTVWPCGTQQNKKKDNRPEEVKAAKGIEMKKQATLVKKATQVAVMDSEVTELLAKAKGGEKLSRKEIKVTPASPPSLPRHGTALLPRHGTPPSHPSLRTV